MQNLLVAVDFTYSTGKLLAVALELAGKCGASVCLLHTEPPDTGYVYYAPGYAYDNLIGYGYELAMSEEVRSVRLEHDRQAMEALRKPFDDRGIPTTVELLSGDVATSVLDRAAELPADMIIVGSQRHGTFYKLLLGSVEDRLLQEAPCPVLVVPSDKVG